MVAVISLPLIFAGYQRMYGILLLRAKLHDLKQAGEEIDYRRFSVAPLSSGNPRSLALKDLAEELRQVESALRYRPPLDQTSADGRRQPLRQLNKWYRELREDGISYQLKSSPTKFRGQFGRHTNLLQRVMAALEHPEFGMGQPAGWEFNVDMMDSLWSSADLVAAGFCHRVYSGRYDDAHRCVLSLLSASRTIRRRPGPEANSYSSRYGRKAAEMIWQALQLPDWSDDAQLHAWSESIRRIDVVEAGVRSLQYQRAVNFEYLLRLAGQSGSAVQRDEAWDHAWTRVGKTPMVENIYIPLWQFLWQEQDVCQSLDAWAANINYLRSARAVGLIKTRKYAEAKDGTLPFEPCRFIGPRPGSFNSTRYLFGLYDPDLREDSLMGVFWELAQQRLTITAIAVRRYELAHGNPPPRLSDLVPEYLDEIPLDPMDIRPLRYRADGRNWSLYSIGENGLDDGGDASPIPGDQWDTPRDHVWPQPASNTPRSP